MISPSSLSAMTSKHLGKELRSTASEWYRPASNRVHKSAKSALPSCLLVDHFPCLRVEACRICAPYASAMHGGPRQTPSIGIFYPNTRPMSLLVPHSPRAQ